MIDRSTTHHEICALDNQNTGHMFHHRGFSVVYVSEHGFPVVGIIGMLMDNIDGLTLK